VQQSSQAVSLLRRQRWCLINDIANVLCELGGTKIALGIGDNRIIGVSVAFESVVPRSGSVYGLQSSLSADA
jgi:hypothetical protein